MCRFRNIQQKKNPDFFFQLSIYQIEYPWLNQKNYIKRFFVVPK